MAAAFPSGEWVGFYVYSGRAQRYLMDLILEFRAGAISGEGADGIGPFSILGKYSEDTRECSWTKTYLGQHSVEYVGFGEDKGIWGTWDLWGEKGGFHIWPLGNQPDAKSIEEETSLGQPVTTMQPREMPATAIPG